MRMSLRLDNTLGLRKAEVLSYLRARAAEHLGEVTKQFGVRQFKKRAAAINRALSSEKDNLITMVRQVAEREKWRPNATLEGVLLLMYCTNVVMLETRNDVWPYEYMAFSRRIGELWEPFITTCFEYPVREDVALFIPPLFRDVRNRLTQEVRTFIQSLKISDADKQSLVGYYDQVWQLVTSGEIKLELDLHFCIGEKRYVVDCKSGFGSNEKGNTNRLLLVASVYQNIEPEDYTCLILVRSSEDENNHYLQTLKRSGLWEVYCGAETYPKVLEFSGFDLGAWVKANVTWLSDLESGFVRHLRKSDIAKYLTW